MKKEFKNPEIKITMFSVENIVTASGDTNVSNAKKDLAGYGSVTEKKISELKFTL